MTFAVPAVLTVPTYNVQGIVPSEVSAYLSTNGGASYARLSDSLHIGGAIRASLSQLGAVVAGYPRSAADDAACAAGTGGSGAGGFDGRACYCSRRPGENNSSSCPPGTGAVVSAVVGPAGGRIVLGGLKIDIAPNALPQPVTIQITESTTPPQTLRGLLSGLRIRPPD